MPSNQTYSKIRWKEKNNNNNNNMTVQLVFIKKKKEMVLPNLKLIHSVVYKV